MFLLVHTGIKKSYYLHKPPWKIRENHRESDGGGVDGEETSEEIDSFW